MSDRGVPSASDRYSRQTVLPNIGEHGQTRLQQSSVLVVGCGALGSVSASQLVRAGVGKMSIVDRDFVEYHNLQRQILYTEDDICKQIPKAKAAEMRLKEANSSVEVIGIVDDVNQGNIHRLTKDVDLIIDGLDNLETRYLINDAALQLKIPWIYGAAVSTCGMTMTILPGQTACLRCVYPDLPEVGSVLTCETGGVLSAAPTIIASMQFVEAVKLLVGAKDELRSGLVVLDVWEGSVDSLEVPRSPDCPACCGQYEFLQARAGLKAVSLCGQDSVQILNPNSGEMSFAELAQRLQHLGSVTYSDYMLRFSAENCQLTVFANGRAIVKGTRDERVARSVYAKYVGA